MSSLLLSSPLATSTSWSVSLLSWLNTRLASGFTMFAAFVSSSSGCSVEIYLSPVGEGILPGNVAGLQQPGLFSLSTVCRSVDPQVCAASPPVGMSSLSSLAGEYVFCVLGICSGSPAEIQAGTGFGCPLVDLVSCDLQSDGTSPMRFLNLSSLSN